MFILDLLVPMMHQQQTSVSLMTVLRPAMCVVLSLFETDAILVTLPVE